MTFRFSFVKNALDYYESEICIDISNRISLGLFYRHMCRTYPKFEAWFNSDVESFWIDETQIFLLHGRPASSLDDYYLYLGFLPGSDYED